MVGLCEAYAILYRIGTSFIDETISDNNAEKQIRELTEQCKR